MRSRGEIKHSCIAGKGKRQTVNSLIAAKKGNYSGIVSNFSPSTQPGRYGPHALEYETSKSYSIGRDSRIGKYARESRVNSCKPTTD
jgi:hypothetical protein